MADALGIHRCPVCSKTYKRREHLQRHRSTHTRERPHRCIVCGASFQRSDVLKRHLQTCDGPSTPSSSRRRACDRCVRQKKACNSAQPCFNCQRRSVVCHYSIPPSAPSAPSASSQPAGPPVIDDPSNHNNLDETTAHPDVPQTDQPPSEESVLADSTFDHVPFDDLDTLIQEAVSQFQIPDSWFDVSPSHSSGTTASLAVEPDLFHKPPNDSLSSRYRGYSFHFLSDFTSRTGLVSSFECATLAQRQQIVAAFHPSYLQQPPLDPFSIVPPSTLPPEEPTSQVSGFVSNVGPVSSGLSSWSLWLHNPIVINLQQVVLLLKNVVRVKPNNSTITLDWSAALEQQCLQFFSPPRVVKFIELYWSVWHPNVNFLHRPTFNPTATKPILLATMALIGACVSPDRADNDDAKMWFNCVEEMVFTDDDFCSDMEPPAVSDIDTPVYTPENRLKLQALQAAYHTARDLGIDTARHMDYSAQPKHEFIWFEFVMREELIRIFTWIFLLDTAFVIFNNLPHRMVIKEMKMDMASPEACFQAETADDCIGQIYRWMPSTSPFCTLLLRDAIENLCIDVMSPEVQQQYSQLGPLNLFAMVSAIHYMIFQHQNLFAVEGQLVPIRNGLRNWIGIWERYAEVPSALSPHGLLQEDCPAPALMWKRIGFFRSSPEYWLLGSLLTDRLSATAVTSTDMSSANGNLSGPFPTSANARGKARSAEPILEKYDQTSMRQVNELINGFQKFNIG
ncbi:hypothetical protein CHGG_02070 [Chaetomium globosum CBS 148.51]|uniref:Uncharacterized protein n=1 Tax=Chaetomium globosum (strain ATCC 6205 / CBS 148.51 / DSM 1962 / NBRC 6347 / NRRL 1970) TaxID=306901 RepID=Q2HCI4_CHAGB|nr:uncharacterized protein CHGG_02070 [Chaetomium globosum CBS 148.51]EAQ93835.1 hypothetical protein CHGG_02070 [Chaetomium globosum CBS 148.51]